MTSTRRFLADKILADTRPCLVGVGFPSSGLQVWIRYLLSIAHANRTHGFRLRKSHAGDPTASFAAHPGVIRSQEIEEFLKQRRNLEYRKNGLRLDELSEEKPIWRRYPKGIPDSRGVQNTSSAWCIRSPRQANTKLCGLRN